MVIGEAMDTLLARQQAYFKTQETKSYAFRIETLKTLKAVIKKYEKDILNALYLDLHKSEMEAYSTEVGYVYHSIDFLIKHLKKYMRVRKVKTPLFMLNTKSYQVFEPLGSVLIIGPYNYPFQLVIEPLIGAIAAGNTAILKASEFVENTDLILKKIITEAFDPSYIAFVRGDYKTNEVLINMPFDHIFFTGSTKVGKIVYEAAAKNLVPVTLELGGKSPVIICKDANLKVAARRIVFGKFTNAGQTCIAPDYIYVDQTIKTDFTNALVEAIDTMYSDIHAFGKVLDRHQARINRLIDPDKVLYTGKAKENEIPPILLHNVTFDDHVMQEEIFGPLLPILTFESVDEVISTLLDKEKPLALYLFTNDKQVIKRIFTTVSFGGGAINDTLMHVANPYLPFGGIGASGIGHYHGFYSFQTFSKLKSFIKKGTFLDPSFAYPPYTPFKQKLIKFFLK